MNMRMSKAEIVKYDTHLNDAEISRQTQIQMNSIYKKNKYADSTKYVAVVTFSMVDREVPFTTNISTVFTAEKIVSAVIFSNRILLAAQCKDYEYMNKMFWKYDSLFISPDTYSSYRSVADNPLEPCMVRDAKIRCAIRMVKLNI